MLRKIPDAMVYRYNDFVDSRSSGISNLETLAKFLIREAQIANKAGTTFANDVSESSRNVTNSSRNRNFSQPTKDFSRSRQRSKQVLNTTERSRSRSSVRKPDQRCKYCQNNSHKIYDCRRFAKLTVTSRWRWVKAQSLCFKCLDDYHRCNDCDYPSCTNKGCNRLHHSLLHAPRFDELKATASKSITEAQNPNQSNRRTS